MVMDEEQRALARKARLGDPMAALRARRAMERTMTKWRLIWKELRGTCRLVLETSGVVVRVTVLCTEYATPLQPWRPFFLDINEGSVVRHDFARPCYKKFYLELALHPDTDMRYHRLGLIEMADRLERLLKEHEHG